MAKKRSSASKKEKPTYGADNADQSLAPELRGQDAGVQSLLEVGGISMSVENEALEELPEKNAE